MDRFVLPTFAAQQLIGPIREHLVAVHVVRGTGTGLVGIDHEVIAMPTREYLVSRPGDRVGESGVEPAGFSVRQRGGFLDPNDGVNEGWMWAEIGNREVLSRAFGLDAPQRLGGHRQVAERITF